MPVGDFLRYFKEANPNAGLVSGIDSKIRSQTKFSDIPVMLSNPRYDRQNSRLVLDVEVLNKEQRVPTGDLGPTTLFIDDYGPYPGG